MKKIIFPLLAGLAMITPALPQEEAPKPVCRATPEARALDFWTGICGEVS